MNRAHGYAAADGLVPWILQILTVPLRERKQVVPDLQREYYRARHWASDPHS